MTDINIGQITEALNDKMDRDAHNVQSPSAVIIEKQDPTAANNYTWYRKYSDGWVEQGGRVSGWNARENVGSITLPVEMADTNYVVLTKAKSNRGDATDWNFTGGATPKTTLAFSYSVYGIGSGDIATGMSWAVYGMAA